MPQVQDRLLDLLICSPTRYHCTYMPHLDASYSSVKYTPGAESIDRRVGLQYRELPLCYRCPEWRNEIHCQLKLIINNIKRHKTIETIWYKWKRYMRIARLFRYSFAVIFSVMKLIVSVYVASEENALMNYFYILLRIYYKYKFFSFSGIK